MIRTVRRVQLLAVLALLLSGLLHTLVSAQGTTCVRAQARADAARQPGIPAFGGELAEAPEGGPDVIAAAHHHPVPPEADGPRAPSAPCGVADVPVERRTLAPPSVARQLLPSVDGAPPSPLLRSLFRPPRLS